MIEITMVTDPNCGFQAVYLNGTLVSDIGDNATARIDTGYETVSGMLEILFNEPEFEGIIDYQDIGGYQLSREIHGVDFTEYEGYWPESLAKVPHDNYDYAEGKFTDDDDVLGLA